MGINDLDSSVIERFMGKAIIDKQVNCYLGFLEGLILDGSINEREIDALIAWNNNNPDILANPPFDILLSTLNKIYTKEGFDPIQQERFILLINAFKSEKYYRGDTSDIQRLHGLLAGIACDCTLNEVELINLNQWLKAHEYLEDDEFFRDIYALLRPIRTGKPLTATVINNILKQIKKYVDTDNHGTLKQCVDANENPDFHHGSIGCAGKKFCFTGASDRYSKKEWKSVVEQKGGLFVDDLSNTVDYLVICNKGNKAWAHVSYGRKFESARKMQVNGFPILIITEDAFLEI